MKVRFNTATFRLGDEGEIFVTIRNSAGSRGWTEMSTCITNEDVDLDGGSFKELRDLIMEAIIKGSEPRSKKEK